MKMLYQVSAPSSSKSNLDKRYFLNRETAYHYAGEHGLMVVDMLAVPDKSDPNAFYLVQDSRYILNKFQGPKFQTRVGDKVYGGDEHFNCEQLMAYPQGDYVITFCGSTSGDDDYCSGTTTYYPALDDRQPQWAQTKEKYNVHIDQQYIALYNINTAEKVWVQDQPQATHVRRNSMTLFTECRDKPVMSRKRSLPELSEAVQASLEQTLMRETVLYDVQVKELGELSARESELLHPFRDPVTQEIITRPCDLNGLHYQLETLTSRLNEEGIGTDPVYGYHFNKSNIAPAMRFASKFDKVMQQIKEGRINEAQAPQRRLV